MATDARPASGAGCRLVDWHPRLTREQAYPAIVDDVLTCRAPTLQAGIGIARDAGLEREQQRDAYIRIEALFADMAEAEVALVLTEGLERHAFLHWHFTRPSLPGDAQLGNLFGLAFFLIAEQSERLRNAAPLGPRLVWALGHLYQLSYMLTGRSGAAAARLLELICGDPALVRDPATAQALRIMLDRLSEKPPYADHDVERLQASERIVAALGLPRDASKLLARTDPDFRRRDQVRQSVAGAFGPELAAMLLALADNHQISQIYSQPEFARQEPVRVFLASGPKALGAALIKLLDVDDWPSRQGVAGWQDLAQDRGTYRIQPPHLMRLSRGVSHLIGLIARKRIEIDDRAMAMLVRESPRHDGLRTIPFLNQALKLAEQPGETRAALFELAQAGLTPDAWRNRIAELRDRVGEAAPSDASRPPEPEPARHDIVTSARFGLLGKLAAQFGRALRDPGTAELLRSGLAATAGQIKDSRQRENLLRAADILGRGVDPLADLAHQLRPALGDRAERFVDLSHELGGKSSPPAKWLERARRLFESTAAEQRVPVLRAVIDKLVEQDGLTGRAESPLRGLIYLSARWDAAEVAPILTELALKHCYQTRPGTGIKAEKVGNACLWALATLPDGAGVPYLARIQARVKYPKIRKKVDASLNEAAAKAGLSRAQLDEVCVPTHGLDRDGQLALAVGGGQAVLRLDGTRRVETPWSAADGRRLKAPNPVMKADKQSIKAVKEQAKEIEADLSAQAVRLQRIFLEQRDWSVDEWRRHYLDHPLIRPFAERLIWWLGDVAVLPQGDILAGLDGQPVRPDGARLRLWHPIEAPVDQVMAWRERLEALGVAQPFAQAWREIYRVTDAERETGTYSNRWAGHILKQHQFMQLARLNGWTVTHRMWVDAPNDAPAHLVIPAFGLVADYWVEGAGGDDPPVLDSQAYIYVNTDRLRFSTILEGAPAGDSAYGPPRAGALAIEDVPPIVLSEVMRHCDLFTAVASIANDPAWRDRGAQAAHPNQWQRAAEDYWTRQSTADLTESGEMRRAVLARIVPRLAIADRLALDGNMLRVTGKRHVYRIHLGSAAVLLDDERRHICIVPAPTPQPEMGLPFEGDRQLAVILSKAHMLARDDKITDQGILAQL